MITIDLSDQINWDICIESIEKRLIDINNPDRPDELTDPQIVFGKDTKFFSQDPYGETLHRYLTPIVSRAIGRRLYPSSSFGWVYYNGGQVIPHLDRDTGVQWLCSLTIEQDQPWSFESFVNGKTIAEETKVGRAVVMNGSQYSHSKPIYTGKRAINYIFSFTETERQANLRRRFINATVSDDHLSNAVMLNLPFPVELEMYYELPLNFDPINLKQHWSAVVNFINQWSDEVSIQKNKDYMFATAPTPLLPLQEYLRPQIEQRVAEKLTSAVPKIATFYSLDDISFEWETDSVEDYIAIVPLTNTGQIKLKYGWPSNYYSLIDDPYIKDIELDAANHQYLVLSVCCTEIQYIGGGTDFAVLGYQKIEENN